MLEYLIYFCGEKRNGEVEPPRKGCRKTKRIIKMDRKRDFEKQLLDVMFSKKKRISNSYNHKVQCESTLRSVIQNIKFVSKFNKDFVALTLSLIALEQIGTLFCKGCQPTEYGVTKAAREFMNISDERTLQGITHLRHALAHNFGLAIVDDIKKAKYIEKNGDSKYDPKINEFNYKYLIHHSERNPNIIRRPSVDWDGDFTNYGLDDVANTKLSIHNSFEVFVPSLIEKVKEIYEALQNRHKKGELHFVGKGNDTTEEELVAIAYEYFVYSEIVTR